MNKNKFILYIITVIILFAIPLYMVYQNYDLLLNGQEYLFKVETFDPYDMFRGKYLNINFKEKIVKSNNFELDSNHYDNYYVEIKTDEEGFSYFDNINIVKPKNSNNYYKTKGYYLKYLEGYKIDTPTRYYMNEKQIIEAEKIYNNNADDAYVKVKVKNGNMIITDVFVNNKSIVSYK